MLEKMALNRMTYQCVFIESLVEGKVWGSFKVWTAGGVRDV